MVEDGNIQMDVEICGANPEKVPSEIDAIEKCAERGMVHIAYRIAHYLANRRTAMLSSVFLVPQPLIPYLTAVCVLRYDTLGEEEIQNLFGFHGYEEPMRKEQIRIRTARGEEETSVEEVVIENYVAIVFIVEKDGQLMAFPWLVKNRQPYYSFEIAPPSIGEKLISICLERVRAYES